MEYKDGPFNPDELNNLKPNIIEFLTLEEFSEKANIDLNFLISMRNNNFLIPSQKIEDIELYSTELFSDLPTKVSNFCKVIPTEKDLTISELARKTGFDEQTLLLMEKEGFIKGRTFDNVHYYNENIVTTIGENREYFDSYMKQHYDEYGRLLYNDEESISGRDEFPEYNEPEDEEEPDTSSDEDDESLSDDDDRYLDDYRKNMTKFHGQSMSTSEKLAQEAERKAKEKYQTEQERDRFLAQKDAENKRIADQKAAEYQDLQKKAKEYQDRINASNAQTKQSTYSGFDYSGQGANYSSTESKSNTETFVRDANDSADRFRNETMKADEARKLAEQKAAEERKKAEDKAAELKRKVEEEKQKNSSSHQTPNSNPTSTSTHNSYTTPNTGASTPANNPEPKSSTSDGTADKYNSHIEDRGHPSPSQSETQYTPLDQNTRTDSTYKTAKPQEYDSGYKYTPPPVQQPVSDSKPSNPTPASHEAQNTGYNPEPYTSDTNPKDQKPSASDGATNKHNSYTEYQNPTGYSTETEATKRFAEQKMIDERKRADQQAAEQRAANEKRMHEEEHDHSSSHQSASPYSAPDHSKSSSNEANTQTRQSTNSGFDYSGQGNNNTPEQAQTARKEFVENANSDAERIRTEAARKTNSENIYSKQPFASAPDAPKTANAGYNTEPSTPPISSTGSNPYTSNDVNGKYDSYETPTQTPTQHQGSNGKTPDAPNAANTDTSAPPTGSARPKSYEENNTNGKSSPETQNNTYSQNTQPFVQQPVSGAQPFASAPEAPVAANVKPQEYDTQYVSHTQRPVSDGQTAQNEQTGFTYKKAEPQAHDTQYVPPVQQPVSNSQPPQNARTDSDYKGTEHQEYDTQHVSHTQRPVSDDQTTQNEQAGFTYKKAEPQAHDTQYVPPVQQPVSNSQPPQNARTDSDYRKPEPQAHDTQYVPPVQQPVSNSQPPQNARTDSDYKGTEHQEYDTQHVSHTQRPVSDDQTTQNEQAGFTYKKAEPQAHDTQYVPPVQQPVSNSQPPQNERTDSDYRKPEPQSHDTQYVPPVQHQGSNSEPTQNARTDSDYKGTEHQEYDTQYASHIQRPVSDDQTTQNKQTGFTYKKAEPQAHDTQYVPPVQHEGSNGQPPQNEQAGFTRTRPESSQSDVKYAPPIQHFGEQPVSNGQSFNSPVAADTSTPPTDSARDKQYKSNDATDKSPSGTQHTTSGQKASPFVQYQGSDGQPPIRNSDQFSDSAPVSPTTQNIKHNVPQGQEQPTSKNTGLENNQQQVDKTVHSQSPTQQGRRENTSSTQQHSPVETSSTHKSFRSTESVSRQKPDIESEDKQSPHFQATHKDESATVSLKDGKLEENGSLKKTNVSSNAATAAKGAAFVAHQALSGDKIPPPPGQKYKLTDEIKVVNGVTLHRVEAIKDFGNIKAGMKGGWVEGEHNLSHDGTSWISNEAIAMGNSRIEDNALVKDRATLNGNTKVSGNSRIINEASLNGKIDINDRARVSGKSRLSNDNKTEHIVIGGSSRIIENATLTDNVHVSDEVVIGGNSIVANDSKVYGQARVLGSTKIGDKVEVGGKSTIQGNVQLVGHTIVVGEIEIRTTKGNQTSLHIEDRLINKNAVITNRSDITQHSVSTPRTNSHSTGTNTPAKEYGVKGTKKIASGASIINNPGTPNSPVFVANPQKVNPMASAGFKHELTLVNSPNSAPQLKVVLTKEDGQKRLAECVTPWSQHEIIKTSEAPAVISKMDPIIKTIHNINVKTQVNNYRTTTMATIMNSPGFKDKVEYNGTFLNDKNQRLFKVTTKEDIGDIKAGSVLLVDGMGKDGKVYDISEKDIEISPTGVIQGEIDLDNANKLDFSTVFGKVDAVPSVDAEKKAIIESFTRSSDYSFDGVGFNEQGHLVLKITTQKDIGDIKAGSTLLVDGIGTGGKIYDASGIEMKSDSNGFIRQAIKVDDLEATEFATVFNDSELLANDGTSPIEPTALLTINNAVVDKQSVASDISSFITFANASDNSNKFTLTEIVVAENNQCAFKILAKEDIGDIKAGSELLIIGTGDDGKIYDISNLTDSNNAISEIDNLDAINFSTVFGKADTTPSVDAEKMAAIESFTRSSDYSFDGVGFNEQGHLVLKITTQKDIGDIKAGSVLLVDGIGTGGKIYDVSGMELKPDSNGFIRQAIKVDDLEATEFATVFNDSELLANDGSSPIDSAALSILMNDFVIDEQSVANDISSFMAFANASDNSDKFTLTEIMVAEDNQCAFRILTKEDIGDIKAGSELLIIGAGDDGKIYDISNLTDSDNAISEIDNLDAIDFSTVFGTSHHGDDNNSSSTKAEKLSSSPPVQSTFSYNAGRTGNQNRTHMKTVNKFKTDAFNKMLKNIKKDLKLHANVSKFVGMYLIRNTGLEGTDPAQFIRTASSYTSWILASVAYSGAKSISKDKINLLQNSLLNKKMKGKLFSTAANYGGRNAILARKGIFNANLFVNYNSIVSVRMYKRYLDKFGKANNLGELTSLSSTELSNLKLDPNLTTDQLTAIEMALSIKNVDLLKRDALENILKQNNINTDLLDLSLRGKSPQQILYAIKQHQIKTGSQYNFANMKTRDLMKLIKSKQLNANELGLAKTVLALRQKLIADGNIKKARDNGRMSLVRFANMIFRGSDFFDGAMMVYRSVMSAKQGLYVAKFAAALVGRALVRIANVTTFVPRKITMSVLKHKAPDKAQKIINAKKKINNKRRKFAEKKLDIQMKPKGVQKLKVKASKKIKNSKVGKAATKIAKPFKIAAAPFKKASEVLSKLMSGAKALLGKVAVVVAVLLLVVCLLSSVISMFGGAMQFVSGWKTGDLTPDEDDEILSSVTIAGLSNSITSNLAGGTLKSKDETLDTKLKTVLNAKSVPIPIINFSNNARIDGLYDPFNKTTPSWTTTKSVTLTTKYNNTVTGKFNGTSWVNGSRTIKLNGSSKDGDITYYTGTHNFDIVVSNNKSIITAGHIYMSANYGESFQKIRRSRYKGNIINLFTGEPGFLQNAWDYTHTIDGTPKTTICSAKNCTSFKYSCIDMHNGVYGTPSSIINTLSGRTTATSLISNANGCQHHTMNYTQGSTTTKYCGGYHLVNGEYIKCISANKAKGVGHVYYQGEKIASCDTLKTVSTAVSCFVIPAVGEEAQTVALNLYNAIENYLNPNYANTLLKDWNAAIKNKDTVNYNKVKALYEGTDIMDPQSGFYILATMFAGNPYNVTDYLNFIQQLSNLKLYTKGTITGFMNIKYDAVVEATGYMPEITKSVTINYQRYECRGYCSGHTIRYCCGHPHLDITATVYGIKNIEYNNTKGYYEYTTNYYPFFQKIDAIKRLNQYGRSEVNSDDEWDELESDFDGWNDNEDAMYNSDDDNIEWAISVFEDDWFESYEVPAPGYADPPTWTCKNNGCIYN